MKIGFIPLDERPVNTRYPEILAQIIGIDLIKPEQSILSQRRQAGDCSAIGDWLNDNIASLDALIIAIPTFGYGGLIASRITHESIGQIIQQLEQLRAIRQNYPDLKIFVFDLIMRTSRSNDGLEEPSYWSEVGTKIYEYQQLWDRSQQGQDIDNKLNEVRQSIPDSHLQDFTQRRLRNHIINLTELHMLSDGVFDLLVISSDDTSEYGMGTQEKRWLREQVQRMNLQESTLLMYPGADEVGAVLLARAINESRQFKPKFVLEVAINGDEELIAPFEDSPVRVTLERQIHALGGELIDDIKQADFIVAMNPPSRENPMQFPDPSAVADDRQYRETHLQAFSLKIQEWVDAGHQVIVVDVAYPNGSDTAFIEALRKTVAIDQLAAYGAWNTAGNTIGVALAQGIATHFASNQVDQQRFLVRRFVEDWAYQAIVRYEMWQEVQDSHEEYLKRSDEILQLIEERLQMHLASLKPFGETWRIVSGSVRHPWQRLFEVDFDLEQL